MSSNADSKKLKASRVIAWVESNPQVEQLFERHALAEVNAGRKFGGNAIAERVRWYDLVSTSGEPVKIPNDAVPLLVRRLVAKHPDARPYVTLRRSMFDALGEDSRAKAYGAVH